MGELFFAFTFPGGRKVADVTSVTLANNTALTVNKTVGTGKRWLLLSIRLTNPDNVARNCSIIHYKEAALTNVLDYLGYIAGLAAATAYQVPNTTTGTSTRSDGRTLPKVLDAGETVSVNWAAGGVSAGGTDADGLVVEYLELDVA